MRGSTKLTPARSKSKEEHGSAKNSSGKKMVQARLPFKILAAGSTSIDGSDTDKIKATSDRKRRLSYEIDDIEDNAEKVEKGSVADSKENAVVTTAKKLKSDVAVEIILLEDDDDDDGKDEGRKHNASSIKAALQVGGKQNSMIKPKKRKRSGAGTPQSTNVAARLNDGSASKVQIKIPLKRNKGKKSISKPLEPELSVSSLAREKSLDSSDDLCDENTTSALIPPRKRPKVSDKNSKSTNIEHEEVVVISLDSDCEAKETHKVTETKGKENITELNLQAVSTEMSMKVNEGKTETKRDAIKIVAINGQPIENNSAESNISPNPTSNSTLLNDTKNTTSSTDEIDDESNDSVKSKLSTTNPDESELLETEDSGRQLSKNDQKTMQPNTSDINKEDDVRKKSLTPKQLKLMEQRRQVREEKERKLHEEKLQKQKEKEQRELVKKREREEREEQRQKERMEKEVQRQKEREEKEEYRRKEREEKDELKRKEREEKEHKRLAESEAKRKKIEAKEEETRKKEEERKRKELEKEEVELKKKKAAEAFSKFFVPKSSRNTAASIVGIDSLSHERCGKSNHILAFRPFQVRGDMKLAPTVRRVITPQARKDLDICLDISDISNDVTKYEQSELYLSALQSGKIKPGKWRRPSTESKDDVIIVEDELERVGQAIVEEANTRKVCMRAKFYKFTENRRPPFFGTWRKKSKIIKPKKPFAQDTNFFDYEVDSDVEWEDEEPGESLDGDDDRDKESDDDFYDIDNECFVLHGHLSEEEMHSEDEFGNNNDREAQQAKLKILQQEFVEEMKKQTEKIKPRLIGCIWVDENGNQPELCPKIIWDALQDRTIFCDVPPQVNESDQPERNELNNSVAANGIEKTADKLKHLVLSERNLKDLIRLVHGNRHSKAFLIKEFIAFIQANEDSVRNGDVLGPRKSTVRDKISEFAEWQVTEHTSHNEKKKTKKMLCWVASEEVLQRMELGHLSLRNKWQYMLQPKSKLIDNTDSKPQTTESIATATNRRENTNFNDKPSSTVEPETTTLAHINNTKVFTDLTTVSITEQIADGAPRSARKDEPADTVNKEDPSPTTLRPKTAAPPKKRVQLLMSVPRDQIINTQVKNALISQFLMKTSKNKSDDDSNNSICNQDSNPVTKNLCAQNDPIVVSD